MRNEYSREASAGKETVRTSFPHSRKWHEGTAVSCNGKKRMPVPDQRQASSLITILSHQAPRLAPNNINQWKIRISITICGIISPVADNSRIYLEVRDVPVKDKSSLVRTETVPRTRVLSNFELIEKWL